MQEEKNSFLDITLVEALKPTWEKALYAAILLIAIVSRFWNLGAYAFSHDECSHALYSYYLYNGTGYQHNPMMHGPFLYHIIALGYTLFGDTDFTARIMPAFFGVLAVMSPLLLRRWLGRWGTALAVLGVLISPNILFYSRMVWMDIYFLDFTIVMIAAMFHFFHTHKPAWMYTGMAALALAVCTKETSFMFGFLAVLYLLALLLWERTRQKSHLWLFLGASLISVSLLVGGALLSQAGASAAAAAAGTDSAETAGKGLELVGALCSVIGMILAAGTICTILIPSRYPLRSRLAEALRDFSWRTSHVQVTGPLGEVEAVPVRSFRWKRWGIVAVILFLIYTLLYTTFFTNPAGFAGLVTSITYWLAQHDVNRGGQPWYYYFLLLGMYDFLPLLFGVVATFYYLIRRIVVLLRGEPEDPRDGEPAGQGSTRLPWREESVFVAFLVFWSAGTLILYTWAGEKMPFMGMHLAIPLVLLTAKFLGDIFGRVAWREVWQRGGAWFMLLLPVTVFGIARLITLQPFQGMSLWDLKATGGWILTLLVTLLLVALVLILGRRLRGRLAWTAALATLVIVLGIFTVRFAWMAAYKNRDMATELLVYAHGTPDLPLTMDEIADISERTVGDKQIAVAYDDESSWPLEWYMREYPNRAFYGGTPTRDKLNVPIVLYGSANESKVKPFLGDDYNCFKRRLRWWPNQQYYDLTWQRVWKILSTPEQREKLWNILYWRKYPKSTDDWYHVDIFYYCVRKDVASQMWDQGAGPAPVLEEPLDPYAEATIQHPSTAVWGTMGTEAGQFNHPRGIAVGPDGFVYVVDSDNARIQVFDASGAYLRQWGSYCDIETELGCVDPDGSGPLSLGDGQFKEPWGITVDAEGLVYVADTWNHRVQVFDEAGFVRKWGTLGQTAERLDLMYGPRDVAIDAQGNILVTDTGNKRVLVYTKEGTLVDIFGTAGAAQGQIDEPVGIDVDSEGHIYLVDTWNRQIDVYDTLRLWTKEWPVDAWAGQSIVNKPYLAVDDQDRIYITDPEGYRVVVFAKAGEPLAVFGTYGFDADSFSLPTGIDVDAEGNIYVTDTNAHRVQKFGRVE